MSVSSNIGRQLVGSYGGSHDVLAGTKRLGAASSTRRQCRGGSGTSSFALRSAWASAASWSRMKYSMKRLIGIEVQGRLAKLAGGLILVACGSVSTPVADGYDDASVDAIPSGGGGQGGSSGSLGGLAGATAGMGGVA